MRVVHGRRPGRRVPHDHPLVGDVHVTGSDKTHDAIVFGAGEEGARRKAANDPVLTKPVSCELGNVSPVVVVPGVWTRQGDRVPGASRGDDARQQRGIQLPDARA